MPFTSLQRATITGGAVVALALSCLNAPHQAEAAPSGLGLSDAVIAKLHRALAERAGEPVSATGQGSSVAALCGDTNFTVWIRSHTQGWSATDREDADTLATITMLQALSAPQGKKAFGLKGQYTGVLNREMGKLRGFWNINGKRVRLLPAHGAGAKNVAGVARVLRSQAGLSTAEANATARTIARRVNSKRFNYGNHPMLTLNALAFTATRSTAPSIVVGDGILQAMAELGWSGVAPQEILAHEYGHQIQFANGLASSSKKSTASQTRYSELQADAFGSYYLHHPKGGNMGWKNVNTFLQVVYATGDCSFTSVSHHGTPNQRMAAANWGAGMVQAVGAGRIAPTRGFATAYKKAHPHIVG